MNLNKWQTFVKKLSRLLYTDTLTHLIVDYLLDLTFLERRTFAKLHSLEALEKEIQVILTNLTKRDGLLNFIEVKPDKFLKTYGDKCLLPWQVV